MNRLEKVASLNFDLPIPTEGLERLANILRRSETGFMTDVRTPLWDGRSREEILSQLDSRIGSTSIQLLNIRDEEERKRVGPMSLMYPINRRMEDIEEYYHQRFDADILTFNRAVSIVARLLPPHSVRPLGWRSSYDAVPHTKNWGAPWFTSDPVVGPLYLERAQSITSPEQIYPSVLFWRGQQDGPGQTKQRVVFGADKAIVIFEARWMYSILNSLRRVLGHAAWGTPDEVSIAVTKLLNMAKDLGVPVVSGDFSGFDSSVPPQLIDACCEIEKLWLIPEMSDSVDISCEAFKTVPLIIPYEIKRGRNGGVPSGFATTNDRDGRMNRIANVYAALRNDSVLHGIEVMGDDFVSVFKPAISPEKLSDAVGELGLKMKPEKQFIHDDAALFLQKLHLREYQIGGTCVGIHSPYRSMSGLTGMERWHKEEWSEYMVSARAIMQVENVKHDPRFLDFVKFYIEGDNLVRSGMDPVEIFQRAGGASGIREALDKASFPYNVYDPGGVNDFVTVQIIRDLT